MSCNVLMRTLIALGVVAFASPAIARPVQFGQLDHFESGTTDGWGQGAASPTPTINVPTGGPAGSGDHYILNTSNGTFGAGSKQVLLNRDQWAGNYVTAGVTRIDMSVRNFGTTDLSLRIALAGGSFGASRYASTNAVAIPASSAWTRVSFELDAASMTSLGATDSLATTLGSVAELRLVSAAGGPAYNGDNVAAQLGVDDVRALRQPGDANFDNAVNFNDLLLLAKNYNTSTGATWQQGDFDFNGAVTFNDLLTLARNYNSASLSGDSSFEADWALAQTLVPEPASAFALLLLARRRR